MGQKELIRILAKEVDKKPVYFTRDKLREHGSTAAWVEANKLLAAESCFKQSVDDNSEVVFNELGTEIRLREKNSEKFISVRRKVFSDLFLVGDNRNIKLLAVDESSLAEILNQEIERRGFCYNAPNNGVSQAK